MKRLQNDAEFHMPERDAEFVVAGDEESAVAGNAEFAAARDESDSRTKEYEISSGEYNFPGGRTVEETHPRHPRGRRRSFLTVGAVTMTVVVLEAANGYDVLARDPFNDPSSGHSGYESAFNEPEKEPIRESEKEPDETESRMPESSAPDESQGRQEEPPESSDSGKEVNSQASQSGNDKEPEETAGTGETADSAFPRLSNSEPNGYVSFDQQYEEYILLTWADNSGRETQWIYDHSGGSGGETGISYDRASNTLTLSGVKLPGAGIQTNYMGNGLTINLVGDNELANISSYGWGYGGSITFTGSGSLILNEAGAFGSGITLDAEWSESCVMIDSGVYLEVYGNGAPAINVMATSAEKGIYYLAPLSMTGGIRAEGAEIDDFKDRAGYFYFYEKGIDTDQMGEEWINEERERFHDFIVIDEDGEAATHIVFE